MTLRPSLRRYDAYANAAGVNPKLLGIGLLPYLTALSLPLALLLLGVGFVLQYGPGWASDGGDARAAASERAPAPSAPAFKLPSLPFAAEPAPEPAPELSPPSGGFKLPF